MGPPGPILLRWLDASSDGQSGLLDLPHGLVHLTLGLLGTGTLGLHYGILTVIHPGLMGNDTP